MASCGVTFLKYLFFVFNFIFWILGIAVLAVGIYSRVQGENWEKLMDSKSLFHAANILIAAGVIVTVIGFLGCCGACKQYEWMLVSYATLIILIFILEIAAGIYAYTKRDSLQKSLEKGLKKAIHTSYGQPTLAAKGLTKAVDWFQKKVKCCGSTGPEEYASNEYWRKNAETLVPKSCCAKSPCDVGLPLPVRTKDSTATAITALKSIGKIYSEGCVSKGKKYAKDNLYVIGGIGIGIAVVELLGIIFSICLCQAFRDNKGGQTA